MFCQDVDDDINGSLDKNNKLYASKTIPLSPQYISMSIPPTTIKYIMLNLLPQLNLSNSVPLCTVHKPIHNSASDSI